MEAHPYRATVIMVHSTSMSFRFIDCMAVWETDHDPEGGYGKTVKTDKYGDVQECLSHVAGMVGGSVECLIYPEQFGIPISEKGECLRFYVRPKEILDACVRAIAEDRLPPEYMI